MVGGGGGVCVGCVCGVWGGGVGGGGGGGGGACRDLQQKDTSGYLGISQYAFPILVYSQYFNTNTNVCGYVFW